MSQLRDIVLNNNNNNNFFSEVRLVIGDFLMMEDNALAIGSIHQSHPPGTHFPIVLDPTAANSSPHPTIPRSTAAAATTTTVVGHLLGLGIQILNLHGNIRTFRDMLHHEPYKGAIDRVDTLGCQRG